jgi:hypothetical protein
MPIKPILLVEGEKEILFASSQEAAKYLGVTPSCICYYIKTGKLIKVKSRYDEFLEEFQKSLNIELNHNMRKVLLLMVSHIKDSETIRNNFIAYAKKTPVEKSKRTVDNFKLIYGDVAGEKRYKKWVEKIQNNLNKYKSLEWFRNKSVWSKNFWMDRGYTNEEAQRQISKYQSKNAKKANINRDPSSRTTNMEYWIKKGYSREEARNKLRERQTTRKTLEEIKEPLLEYYTEVWYHTNKNKHLIDGIENRSVDLHIDHIFSIRDGFDFGVPANIIGSIVNLRMLSAKKNIKKYRKSDMSLENLYERYNGMVQGKRSNYRRSKRSS